MLTVSEEQIQNKLTPDSAIRVLEEAFRRDYQQTVQMPSRLQIEVSDGSVLLVMPCYDSALPGAGLKLVTVRNGAQLNKDRIQAIVFLVEHESGELCAVLSANYLTDVRTAAVSAIATKLLSRPEATTLGVFGTGRQALAHILVLRHIRAFRSVLVCGSHSSQSNEFALRLSAIHGIHAKPVDASTCVMQSDVLCTCTTSKVPLFDGSLVREGTHLNLVGAFQPDTREVDDQVINRALIVVDTYKGAFREAGDLLIPLRQGIITRGHIVADLHEIVSGKKPARRNDQEITVFKSVGCAFEDLVIAKFIYDDFQRENGAP